MMRGIAFDLSTIVQTLWKSSFRSNFHAIYIAAHMMMIHLMTFQFMSMFIIVHQGKKNFNFNPFRSSPWSNCRLLTNTLEKNVKKHLSNNLTFYPD